MNSLTSSSVIPVRRLTVSPSLLQALLERSNQLLCGVQALLDHSLNRAGVIGGPVVRSRVRGVVELVPSRPQLLQLRPRAGRESWQRVDLLPEPFVVALVATMYPKDRGPGGLVGSVVGARHHASPNHRVLALCQNRRSLKQAARHFEPVFHDVCQSGLKRGGIERALIRQVPEKRVLRSSDLLQPFLGRSDP